MNHRPTRAQLEKAIQQVRRGRFAEAYETLGVVLVSHFSGCRPRCPHLHTAYFNGQLIAEGEPARVAEQVFTFFGVRLVD